ncbi:MAG: PKD domain-containing protein, partial [Armatimonadota bacterium]
MAIRPGALPVHGLAAMLLLCATRAGGMEPVELRAKDTLTPVEMDVGDVLQFRLRGGRVFTLALEDTHAAIVERVEPGGIVYRFTARVLVDGEQMVMERYACSQECFYEPYVINGVRIWLDIVRDVFDLIPIRYPRTGNRQCFPRKAARLALQDATLRVCPQETRSWIETEREFLDVGDCYNGDDCYLGPYLGQACHVGMDLNHARGSPLFAPIDFDTQAYFNSLAMGHNNNRWRGIRRWENGDIWALQTHHLIDLLVPENTPLAAGTKYATTAGVHVGSHEHTHFEFKIARPRDPPSAGRRSDAAAPLSIAVPIDFDDESELAQAQPEVLHLDPWIMFWQIFEDRNARRGELHAAISPLSPARTGDPVRFAAEGSRPGPGGGDVRCYWAFGDGGAARGMTASHVFARRGVYPVTLVVDNGVRRAAITHHLTVAGEPVAEPVLALAAPDEPSFLPRPVSALDVYGRPVRLLPHRLYFVARASRLMPRPKTLRLQNLGRGDLGPVATRIEYEEGTGWLKAAAKDEQAAELAVDATGLAPGTYRATVEVT